MPLQNINSTNIVDPCWEFFMQPAEVANYSCKEYAMVLIADFDFAVASQQKALN